MTDVEKIDYDIATHTMTVTLGEPGLRTMRLFSRRYGTCVRQITPTGPARHYVFTNVPMDPRPDDIAIQLLSLDESAPQPVITFNGDPDEPAYDYEWPI